MDLVTPRLVLHPITPAEAARIVAGVAAPGDDWHPEYPLADELDVLPAIANADPALLDPVFRLYLIRRRADGLAVGGIGFLGVPDDGVAELGYGLVPAARGRGYATEALRAAVGLALRHGASAVVAETTDDNRASQRVLEKGGFSVERHGDGGIRYRRDARAT